MLSAVKTQTGGKKSRSRTPAFFESVGGYT